MERLDRAYASKEWLHDHAQTIVKNLPITLSDHAPILLQMTTDRKMPNRRYQVENWSFGFNEVRSMVQSTWDLTIIGSPTYVMSRRLSLLRNCLRAWCLDRKLFWGINWKQLYDTLHVYVRGINTLQEGMVFTQQHRSLLQDTSLAYAYWRQRIKTNYLQVGDLPSKLLFCRLRPRSQRNIIHMLQRSDGEWISNHNDIEDMIKKHFTTLFTSSENSTSAHPCYQENIDLVLRELDLPRLTNVDTEFCCNRCRARR